MPAKDVQTGNHHSLKASFASKQENGTNKKMQIMISMVKQKMPTLSDDEIFAMILEIKGKRPQGLKGMTMNDVLNEVEQIQGGTTILTLNWYACIL